MAFIITPTIKLNISGSIGPTEVTPKKRAFTEIKNMPTANNNGTTLGGCLVQNAGKRRHKSHAIGNETARYAPAHSIARMTCQKITEKKLAFDDHAPIRPNKTSTAGATRALLQRAKASISADFLMVALTFELRGWL